jgi:hypothetical protein
MEEVSAGIDWASELHALCVVDAAGGKLAGELFAHDEEGIRAPNIKRGPKYLGAGTRSLTAANQVRGSGVDRDTDAGQRGTELA